MAWRTVVHWLEPFLGEREQLALGARGTLGGDHRDRGARLGGESQAAGRHEVTGRAKRQESEHVWGCSREVAASRCNGKLHEAPCWWPSGLVGLGGSVGLGGLPGWPWETVSGALLANTSLAACSRRRGAFAAPPRSS